MTGVVSRMSFVPLLAGGLFLASDVAVAAALPVGLPPSAVLLLRYDTNHDNSVSKEEMEAGLKADYDAADANHDSCLDRNDVRAENARRLRVDAGQASPLVDWNLNGCVDMAEFGNTVRSYFGFADRSKDGAVSLTELRGPSMPLPVPGSTTNTNDTNDKRKTSTADVDPGVSY